MRAGLVVALLAAGVFVLAAGTAQSAGFDGVGCADSNATRFAGDAGLSLMAKRPSGLALLISRVKWTPGRRSLLSQGRKRRARPALSLAIAYSVYSVCAVRGCLTKDVADIPATATGLLIPSSRGPPIA